MTPEGNEPGIRYKFSSKTRKTFQMSNHRKEEVAAGTKQTGGI